VNLQVFFILGGVFSGIYIVQLQNDVKLAIIVVKPKPFMTMDLSILDTV